MNSWCSPLRWRTILWHCPFLFQIKSMLELGEFIMLSSEMTKKKILLSVLLIIQLGVTILWHSPFPLQIYNWVNSWCSPLRWRTILWHCPFLLQIKIMIELSDFMMLSSKMNNKLWQCPFLLQIKSMMVDGAVWINDALLWDEEQSCDTVPFCFRWKAWWSWVN